MSLKELERQLDRFNSLLRIWRADVVASLWGAAVLIALFLLPLLDILFRFPSAGRMVCWAGLMMLVAAGSVHLVGAATRRRPAESIAARLEKSFPQLDNHLINYLQFASLPRKDAMVSAYLRSEIPGWRDMDFRQARNRKPHFRSHLILLAAFVLFMLPSLFLPSPWFNAVARIANPFSSRPPSTLAVIEEVDPGDAKRIAGDRVELSVRARGKPGQPVRLAIRTSDGERETIELGALSGDGVEKFVHGIAELKNDLEYQFFAGDDLSPKYSLHALPPLALASLRVAADPPDYTGMEPFAADALQEAVEVPAGAEMNIFAAFNRDCVSVSLKPGPTNEQAMRIADASSNRWQATVSAASRSEIEIRAEGIYGDELEASMDIDISRDVKPAIRILAPKGTAILGPGSRPGIRFEVNDDYGIERVAVEELPLDDKSGASEVVAEWTPEGKRVFEGEWEGDLLNRRKRPEALFRVVACDNALESQHSESPPIHFKLARPKDMADEEKKTLDETTATLSGLIKLQKGNLEAANALSANAAETGKEKWEHIAAVQKKVRATAGKLLANPNNPLGTLKKVVRELYDNEMRGAVYAFQRTAAAASEKRRQSIRRGIVMQKRILRVLDRVDSNMNLVEKNRQISDLLAMMDAIIKSQTGLVKDTRSAGAEAERTLQKLASGQDSLAGDVLDFVGHSREEARSLEKNAPKFAEVASKVAEGCEENEVAQDMFRAAGQLEETNPSLALPLQVRALNTLKKLRELLTQWRMDEGKKKLEETLAEIGNAKKKMQKLERLQSKVVETIREARKRKDLSDEEFDSLMEEIDKLKENIKNAALKLARDLHIFPELPVGNDLVEDISQIYEEVEQVEGSESAPAKELGLQKEDQVLDALQKETDRLEGMEKWLGATPDNTRRLTENFDQSELPEIPEIPMPSEMQDLISDLLEQQESIENKSDDSATNQGASDYAEGWKVSEGEFTSYAAKGKSGNTRPDHNEQTGRSLVGREGQANGETAAGSGSIEEGDPNIEARRTQDPSQSGHVQLDGHTDAKATGGGKLGGYDDEYGMSGTGPRRDAKTRGSMKGLQAMLRQQAQELHAKATLSNLRVGSLDEAIHNMQRAEKAMAEDYPIRQVREFQKRAAAALRETKAELEGGFVRQAPEANGRVPETDDQLAATPDQAPARYRKLVAEYYKRLSE